jgi:hypothetical protein
VNRIHTFAEQAIPFFETLTFSERLPHGVSVMNPYQTGAMPIMRSFLNTFYSDTRPRLFLWGINPGRFGGGITGIPFTDPFALKNYLKIDSPIDGQREISAEFMYMMIEAFGGTTKFYSSVYITSLSPLGFLKSKKNYNFYDEPPLFRAAMPFIERTMQTQIAFGAHRAAAISLGTGKLFSILSELNARKKFFQTIIPLEHPRFIMQYRRKTMKDYIKKYVHTLQSHT